MPARPRNCVRACENRSVNPSVCENRSDIRRSVKTVQHPRDIGFPPLSDIGTIRFRVTPQSRFVVRASPHVQLLSPALRSPSHAAGGPQRGPGGFPNHYGDPVVLVAACSTYDLLANILIGADSLLKLLIDRSRIL